MADSNPCGCSRVPGHRCAILSIIIPPIDFLLAFVTFQFIYLFSCWVQSHWPNRGHCHIPKGFRVPSSPRYPSTRPRLNATGKFGARTCATSPSTPPTVGTLFFFTYLAGFWKLCIRSSCSKLPSKLTKFHPHPFASVCIFFSLHLIFCSFIFLQFDYTLQRPTSSRITAEACPSGRKPGFALRTAP